MTTETIQRIEQDGQLLVQQAGTIKVVDAASFQSAGAFLRRVTAGLKMGHDLMDPICDAANTSHKVATSQRSKLLAPFEQAKRIVGLESANWQEAERDRVAREQRLADAERRRLEDEERLKNAATLEAMGKPKAAEAALTAPVKVSVVVPPVVAAPKAEGVSFREEWDFEIIDQGLIPREYLVPDEKAIRAAVRMHKAETKIPGIKAVPRTITSVRA